jgi:hypothetical protein
MLLTRYCPSYTAIGMKIVAFTWAAPGTPETVLGNFTTSNSGTRTTPRGLLCKENHVPNGSWCYTEPNGRVHTISAERAREFMESTHRSATVMVAMLDKLREAGVLDNTVEAEAEPRD